MKKNTLKIAGEIIGIILGFIIIGAIIYTAVTLYSCASLKFLDGKAKADGLLIYTEEDDGIRIIGLTDEGRSEKYVVIPDSIEGKPVKYIGCGSGLDASAAEYNFGSYENAQFSSEVLEKIFIRADILFINSATWGTPELIGGSGNFKGFFIIPCLCEAQVNGGGFNVYRSSGNEENGCCLPNVFYDYNYADSPNGGIYWIDNAEYGAAVDYVPPYPQREGYEFGGWFKEPECINKWDFETDVLPEERTEINEDGEEEVVYQETKLYAKWVYTV